MNIIIDKGLFKRLTDKYEVCSVKFGSNNEGSDKDIAHFIRYDEELEAVCPYFKGNYLQYKTEEGNDHIIININQFVTSLVTGDNFLAYKLIGLLDSSPCMWNICDANSSNYFDSYKKYKAILSVAERDFKDYTKLSKQNNDYSKRKSEKKLNFSKQGLNEVLVYLGKPEVKDVTQKILKETRELLTQKMRDGLIPFMPDPYKIGNVLFQMRKFSVGYDSFERYMILELYNKTYTDNM